VKRSSSGFADRHGKNIFIYSVSDITQYDVVAVGGGGAQCGEGVGARSSTSAVAAGAEADAGSECGEVVEWQMASRRSQCEKVDEIRYALTVVETRHVSNT
jgi:hypothetical protein